MKCGRLPRGAVAKSAAGFGFPCRALLAARRAAAGGWTAVSTAAGGLALAAAFEKFEAEETARLLTDPRESFSLQSLSVAPLAMAASRPSRNSAPVAAARSPS